MNDSGETLADMYRHHNSVTVRFRKAGGYEIATFENGATAYDFMNAAVRADLIICVSTVTGPGADNYAARGNEVFAARQQELREELRAERIATI